MEKEFMFVKMADIPVALVRVKTAVFDRLFQHFLE